MNKAETTFIKLSQQMEPEAKKRKYPISRLYMGMTDVGTLGLSNFIHQRALQGRANIGAKPISKSEEILLKAIRKGNKQEKTAEEEKTYPISRALTNPYVSAALAGTGGAIAGKVLKGPKGALLGALASGGAGYFGTRFSRDIDARSEIGKAHKGRSGFGKMKKKQLEALRKNYKPTYENQSAQDRDTAINTGGMLVGHIAKQRVLR